MEFNCAIFMNKFFPIHKIATIRTVFLLWKKSSSGIFVFDRKISKTTRIMHFFSSKLPAIYHFPGMLECGTWAKTTSCRLDQDGSCMRAICTTSLLIFYFEQLIVSYSTYLLCLAFLTEDSEKSVYKQLSTRIYSKMRKKPY